MFGTAIVPKSLRTAPMDLMSRLKRIGESPWIRTTKNRLQLLSPTSNPSAKTVGWSFPHWELIAPPGRTAKKSC